MLFFVKIKKTLFDRKIVELKCLFKEKEDQIALNKGPAIFDNEKRRAVEEKPKVLAVSCQRKHYLTQGE